MNPNTTVKELRAKNYKVRVNHFRYTSPHSDLYPVREIREELGNLSLVEPRGGKILVEITSPDGQHYQGESVCSPKDPFNRSVGLKIAIGRALKPVVKS